MVYCNSCREKNGWPKSHLNVILTCEVCREKTGPINDLPYADIMEYVNKTVVTAPKKPTQLLDYYLLTKKGGQVFLDVFDSEGMLAFINEGNYSRHKLSKDVLDFRILPNTFLIIQGVPVIPKMVTKFEIE